jgi:hypothetical protein
VQDESWIAYCGLYCGDCPIYAGEIADLAKALLGKLDESDFQRIAKGLAELVVECRPLSSNAEQKLSLADQSTGERMT